MREEDFKPGDKVRITRLPEKCCHWLSATDGKNFMENGDIIVLANPPTKPSTFFTDSLGTKLDFLLYYVSENGDRGYMPVEYTEHAEDGAPAICTCNIMVTGCVCGVFEKEKERGDD